MKCIFWILQQKPVSNCYRVAQIKMLVLLGLTLCSAQAHAQPAYQRFCNNNTLPFASFWCISGEYYCNIKEQSGEGYRWCTGDASAGPRTPFNWPRSTPFNPTWGSVCCPVGQVATGSCALTAQRCVRANPVAAPLPTAQGGGGGEPILIGIAGGDLLKECIRALGPNAKPDSSWVQSLLRIRDLQFLCRQIRYESGTRCPRVANVNQCFTAFQALYDAQGCPVATGDPIGYVPAP